MSPCMCGKATYPSAAKAYEALAAQQRRIKHSRKSKKRLARTDITLGAGKMVAYQCPRDGSTWHHGHGSDH
jgi:hypothetical protein